MLQVKIQLKMLNGCLNLWQKQPGSYWIKVAIIKQNQSIFFHFGKTKVTPLARQEHSRSLEELRERSWSLPWPIVEAAALVEDKVINIKTKTL